MPGGGLHLSPPCKMAAALKIVKLMHVAVCLPFESDIVIGIAFLTQSHAPLHDIPQVETDEKQFFHLCGMYAFVVDGGRRDVCLGTAQQQPEEVERYELPAGYPSVAHDFHADKGNEK